MVCLFRNYWNAIPIILVLLLEIFKEPPLISYKKGKSLRDKRDLRDNRESKTITRSHFSPDHTTSTLYFTFFFSTIESIISHCFYLASRIVFISHLALFLSRISHFFYLASRIFYLASRIFLSRISHFLSRIYPKNFFLHLQLTSISHVPLTYLT